MNELESVAEAICEIGRRLWQLGMVAANEGNISVRVAPERVICTPTGVSKGFMSPDEMAELSVEGKLLNGKPVTSEVALHLEVYRVRPDINAVVHAHPTVATAYAISGQPPPLNTLAETALVFRDLPIAAYGTAGTREIVDTVAPHLPDHNAILMQNHGALTLGEDLMEAYYRMEILEKFCRTALAVAQLGSAEKIPYEKLAELYAVRRELGYE